MQGLILAAGRGTRLGRLGERLPKPLIVLANGETLLGRLIRQMIEVGVQDITIVVGHMAEAVIDFVEILDCAASMHFVTAHDYATTNNVVSMLIGLRACARIDGSHDPLLFAECDVVVDDAAFRGIVQITDPNLAVVSPYGHGMDGTVVTANGGFITDVIPPRRQDKTFQLEGRFKTVNIYCFDVQLWRHRLPLLLEWQISEVGASDYYENAIGMIVYALQNELHAHVIPASLWHEIDDLNDLRIANAKLFAGHNFDAIIATHGGWWDLPYIDFAYLRNMHFPTDAMLAQIKEALPDLLRNYGSSQARVDEKLSWLLGVDAQHLVALPGLSVIYPQMKRDYDNALTWIPKESFGEYRSRLPRASIYTDKHWQQVLEQENVKSIILVNPNNPTGNLIAVQNIVHAANNYPKIMFVVDESFVFFTHESSLLEQENLPENIIVLRSMSKEIGMPGLRLGFAYSTNARLMQDIRADQPVWALNSVAEFAMTLMLKYQKEYRESFKHFENDYAEMQARLRVEPGLVVQEDIHGCFLLVEARPDLYPDIGPTLAKYGVLVKDVTGRVTGSNSSVILRLAVRPEPDVNQLIAALRAARAMPL